MAKIGLIDSVKKNFQLVIVKKSVKKFNTTSLVLNVKNLELISERGLKSKHVSINALIKNTFGYQNAEDTTFN